MAESLVYMPPAILSLALNWIRMGSFGNAATAGIAHAFNLCDTSQGPTQQEPLQNRGMSSLRAGLQASVTTSQLHIMRRKVKWLWRLKSTQQALTNGFRLERNEAPLKIVLKMETEEMKEMLSLSVKVNVCIFNQLLPMHSITCDTVSLLIFPCSSCEIRHNVFPMQLLPPPRGYLALA